MSITVSIGGVQRAPLVKSLNITLGLQAQATCEMEFVTTDGWLPAVGAAVEIRSNGTLIYLGSVESVPRQNIIDGTFRVSVTCVDITQITGRRVTGMRTWVGKNAGQIFKEIVANDLLGESIATTFVANNTGPVIASFETKYETVNDRLNTLAETAGMVWRLTWDREARLHLPTAYNASFQIDGTTALVQNLRIEADRTNYANRVIVTLPQAIVDGRVDTYTSAGRSGDVMDSGQAVDGVQYVFQTSSRMVDTPVVTWSGAPMTVAEEGGEEGKDVYWTRGSTQWRINSLTHIAPLATDTMVVTYTAVIETELAAQNNDEVDARAAAEGGTGVYAIHKEITEEISVSDAQVYADNLVAALSAISYTATFETDTKINPLCAGTEPGQRIWIDRAGYGASGWYLIRRVGISDLQLKSGTYLRYRIEASNGPGAGDALTWFRQLMGQGGPGIGLSAGGVAPPASGLAPPPVASGSVTCTVTGSGDVYGIDSAWTFPADTGTATGTERRLWVYNDSDGTDLENVAPLGYAPALDIVSASDGGQWTRPDQAKYVKVGVRTQNAAGVASAWEYSTLTELPAGTGSGETGLNDLTMDTGYSDAGWHGTGLLWRWNADGTLQLRARYTPPLDGISPAISTRMIAVAPHVEFAGGTVQSYAEQPYTGIAQATDGSEKGYIEVTVVNPVAGLIYLQGCVVAADGKQPFRLVTGPTPPQTGRYLSFTLTSGEGKHAPHTLPPITGASVIVEERQTDTGWEGRYKHTFTAPTTDPWYKFTKIQGRWTDSSWTPATAFDQDPGFGPVESPAYSDWWTWPEDDEYHQYRYSPIGLDLTQYLTDAPVVNYHLVGRPKALNLGKSTPASLGKGLSLTSGGLLVATATGLTNGDFEAQLSGWVADSGWSATTSEAYNGTSAKYTAAGIWSAITQVLPVTPGQVKRLTAWCKSNTAGAYVEVIYFNAEGAVLTSTGGEISSGDSWAQYAYTLTAPAGTVVAWARVIASPTAASGRVLVDQIAWDDVTPIAATGAAPVNLSVNKYGPVYDQNGIAQWYFYGSWTPETPTAARATLEFEWQPTSPARAAVPLGSVPISSSSVDLPRQVYEPIQIVGNVLVYVVSTDGIRTLVATLERTIEAGPTGKLNPTQIDLTKTDGFRFNPTTGKLEVTQAGLMARLALGARIGLDVNGALTTTGLVADWVLASLVAVSGSVVVSNAAGSSVTISADGSITIQANGSYSLVIGGSGAALLNQALNVIGDLNASNVSTAGTFSQVFGSGTNVFGGSVQSNGSFLGSGGGTPVLQNGVTGTFTNSVTVVNGVVTGGT